MLMVALPAFSQARLSVRAKTEFLLCDKRTVGMETTNVHPDGKCRETAVIAQS